MALYKVEIDLIHPVTKALTPVTLYVEAGTQAFADGVKDILVKLTTFTGKAAQLRALAAALIEDIDAQA